MVPTSTIIHVRTLDGLQLAATLVTPDQSPTRAVVLVHGGGVTREEGGFFTRLAAGLAEAGIASCGSISVVTVTAKVAKRN